MDREVFIQRLRQLRADWRLSQVELANALCVSRSCVRNWELGDSTPTMEMLADIALFFRVSVDYLLGLDERTCIQINFLSDRAVSAISDLVRTLEEENAGINKKTNK
ncbi:MAG: helix-turn-helix transcriptional regulator [Clostridia bacterium]|nr:helix-turn-helix transcriptional regulator [Clostridia bacterium]